MDTILPVVLSLLGYAFFRSMETAFTLSDKIRFSATPPQVTGTVNSFLSIFWKNPPQFISFLVAGSSLSMLFYGISIWRLATILHVQFSDNQLVIITAMIIAAFLLLVAVSVLLPQAFVYVNPDNFIRIFAALAWLLYYIMYPVVWTMYSLAKFFSMYRQKDFSKEAWEKRFHDYFIHHDFNELPENTAIDAEVKLFQHALDFSTIKLRNCIVPRTEIVAIEKSATINELRNLFITTGLSKIIVYENDLDNVAGYIHSSEMFHGTSDWTTSINQIPIVPETMAAIRLMNLLMLEKKTIAVVVDEFGGIAGIATLEDLVEEIFGDIEDEHDPQSVLAKKIGNNEYIFAGRNEIDKINEHFELDLPESDEYITLAGLILDHCQKFPQLNEEIQIGKCTCKVVRRTATKIELVKISVL
ncbi:MAG: hemolysin family protein [Bacteroidales bacterium]|jgi:CBS domain containing-hemolysin-like protein|nr:hemolysin family protein [Bacteroidales bacterium]